MALKEYTRIEEDLAQSQKSVLSGSGIPVELGKMKGEGEVAKMWEMVFRKRRPDAVFKGL